MESVGKIRSVFLRFERGKFFIEFQNGVHKLADYRRKSFNILSVLARTDTHYF